MIHSHPTTSTAPCVPPYAGPRRTSPAEYVEFAVSLRQRRDLPQALGGELERMVLTGARSPLNVDS